MSSGKTEACGCRSELAALLKPVAGGDEAALADRLVARFGSLAALLAAADAPGFVALVGDAAASAHLSVVRRAMVHALRCGILHRPVLAGSGALSEYLIATMAHRRVEELRVLFLDRRLHLLADECLARGGLHFCQVEPREIVKRALDLNATGIIVAHNHPSGDSAPSRPDVDATCRISQAASLFDISLHDHLVVGRTTCSSMRVLGLL